MANYTTAADIIDDALFRAHEPTDGTSDLDAAALSYLNRCHRALCLGGGELVPGLQEDWWWLRAEGNITLDPILATGSADVTNNNASVTVNGITTASAYVGWHFKAATHDDVFKVTAGASAVLTLESVYTGETTASAVYQLMHLDYDLASTSFKLISPMHAYQGRQYMIYQTTLDRLHFEFPHPEAGIPQKFAPLDENTVRFSHAGSLTSGDYVKLSYDYVMLPTDMTNATTIVPLVPLMWRHVLSDWVLYHLANDKDEQKASDYFALAKSGVLAMQKENRARWGQTGRPGKIEARQRQVRGGIYTENGLLLR